MFGITEIFLSDRAFMSILLSSVEVYKMECHGALLGFKTQGRIVVEYAVPFQAAERKFSEVTPNWRRELKVMEVLPSLVHLQKLGYFHSHPQFGEKKGKPKLSEPDVEYMKKGDTEIVVAINNSRKSFPWSETKNGLSGTIGKYHIVIAGFYKREKDERIMHYRIVCPYAVGFDFAFEE
jgi:proteasome lid subunit RPN8/RPN11